MNRSWLLPIVPNSVSTLEPIPLPRAVAVVDEEEPLLLSFVSPNWDCDTPWKLLEKMSLTLQSTFTGPPELANTKKSGFVLVSVFKDSLLLPSPERS